jgi:hypothetical protein
MGSNAYVVKLPSEFGISPVFNIEDLTVFKGDASTLPLPAITIDGQFLKIQRPGMKLPQFLTINLFQLNGEVITSS